MVTIAPSILASDFAKLAEEIQEVEQGGADWIHVDVMDGHFVPNITIGPLIVEAIRPYTTLPIDVHLMIEQPEKYIADFIRSGADLISVHQETGPHLHRTVHQIKDLGAKAGVVLNPSTPVQSIEAVMEDIDFILFMTVNPGFGGQSFISSVLRKIKQCRQMLDQKGYQHIPIEVDGGVNAQTASLCSQAGAEILVAGSSIFGHEDRKEQISLLRQVCAQKL